MTTVLWRKGPTRALSLACSGRRQQQPQRALSAKWARTGDAIQKFPPWPYREKGYNFMHQYIDSTHKRLNENSKLIVVEGNIGSGKSRLAAELAELLDFYHIEEFSMDKILINRYGQDMRDFYPLFPKPYRLPDINMWYDNPHYNPALMQNMLYFCKFEQYMNALAHILNTGQGVVMERSVFSDFVFVNAMREKRFISAEYLRLYYFKRKCTLYHLNFWPHLVIYLDTPVEKCLERIRARGIPAENNGKVIDTAYLTCLHESYKDMLTEAQAHSKMLIYDWETAADADQVLEDIEKTDLDFFEWHSGSVLEAWGSVNDFIVWNNWRYRFTQKWQMYDIFDTVYMLEDSDFHLRPEQVEQYVDVMQKYVLKSPHAIGFQPARGDSVWKTMTKWTTRTPEAGTAYWFEHVYRDAAYSLTGNTPRDWFDFDRSTLKEYPEDPADFIKLGHHIRH